MAAAADFDKVTKLPNISSYERLVDQRGGQMLGAVLARLGIELYYNTRAPRI